MDNAKTPATVKQILTVGGMKYKLLTPTGQIIRHTPAWRTENGARRWAVRNGYILTEDMQR